MSKLATELPKTSVISAGHGPVGACWRTYQDCDLEDLEAVQKLKNSGATWKQIQAEVDNILGITEPVSYRQFIYHFSQSCKCWRSK